MRDSGHLASMARRAERVEALYMLLCGIAASGSVCPDNAGLGARMTPQCKGLTICGYLGDLRATGHISQVKHKSYRVITITATGAKTGDPRAGARAARAQRKGRGDFRIKVRAAAEASRGIPDDKLYGDLAPDVALLRRRGFEITRAGDALQVGNRVLDAAAVRAVAARERRLAGVSA